MAETAKTKAKARPASGRARPERAAAPAAIERTRNAERTQQDILKAASEEFAEHGLGGARVDRVAERAGINKKLIYYYFESKERLFQSVLEAAYAHIRAAERELHLTDLSPVEAVRRLTEFTWNYYLENPQFIALLNTENLYRARHLASSDDVRRMNSPLISTLGDILERGRIEGVFRGGVDPLQLYISMAALAYFYLSNNSTLSSVFGRDLMSAKARSERLSHIVEFVLGYLLRE